MAQIHNTVFISYRRANEFMAQAVHQNLLANGYDVFIDYKSIGAGSFGDVILRQIEARAHFLLVLTPSALERCTDPDDWLRREIEHAIKHQRNVVPMMFAGVLMADLRKYLTPAMQVLPDYNALNVPGDYFDEAMTRLRQNFLNTPFDTIIHPVLPSDATLVEDIKEESEATPIPTDQQLKAVEHFERGCFHHDRLEYNAAIAEYGLAIELNPTFAFAYNNRGSALDDLGEYDAALADYNRALQLNANFDYAYNNRGYTYFRLGDYDAAIADYEAALRANPRYARARQNLDIARRKRDEQS